MNKKLLETVRTLESLGAHIYTCDASDLPAVASIHISHLRVWNGEETDVILVEPPYCGGSNQSDPTTHANFRHLLGQFLNKGWLHTITGEQGTFGALFDLKATPYSHRLDLVNMCAALRQYPVLDEEVLAGVEAEWLDEAWGDWLGDSFAEWLTEILDYKAGVLGPRWYGNPSENPLRQLFAALSGDHFEIVYESGEVVVDWGSGLKPEELTSMDLFRQVLLEAREGHHRPMSNEATLEAIRAWLEVD